MSSLVRHLAVAGTWRGRRGDRLAAFAQAFGVMVVALALLGTFAAVNAETRAHDRLAGISPGVSNDRGSTVLLAYPMIDESPEDGTTITVQRLFRVVDGAEIPGVPADATGWFVSPELRRVIDRNPTMAVRYPDARVLDDDGVAYAADLRAIQIVVDPGGLELELSGSPTADVPHVVDHRGLLLGAVFLIVVPAAACLIGANQGLTRRLRGRGALLDMLGASPWTIARFGVTTSVMTALPGLIVATVAWQAIAIHLGHVPLTTIQVFAGDLRVAPLQYGLVGAFVVVVTCAATVARLARISVAGVIADRPPIEPTAWRTAPMAVGLIAMTMAPIVGRPGVFVVGLVGLLVGLVVALPRILWATGALLADVGRNRIYAVMTGRGLQSTAMAGGGAFLAIAIAVAVAPFATIWMASAHDPWTEPSVPFWYRAPTGVSPGEVGQVADALGLAVAHVVGGAATDDGALEQLAVVASCEDLSSQGVSASCDAPSDISSPYGPAELVDTTPVGHHIVDEWFFVSATLRADDELRAYFLHRPEPLGVPFIGQQRPVSTLEPWLLGALRAMLGLGIAALLFDALGKGRSATAFQARFGLLGADTTSARWMAIAGELLVGSTCVGVGVVAATASQILFHRFDPVTAVQPGVLALVAVLGLAGVVALAVAAALRGGDLAVLWADEPTSSGL